MLGSRSVGSWTLCCKSSRLQKGLALQGVYEDIGVRHKAGVTKELMREELDDEIDTKLCQTNIEQIGEESEPILITLAFS